MTHSNIKMRETIAQSLRNWRNKKNKSAKDIAEVIDKKLPTYQAYEEGRAEPSLMTLKRLSVYYGCKTIDDFIDFNLVK